LYQCYYVNSQQAARYAVLRESDQEFKETLATGDTKTIALEHKIPGPHPLPLDASKEGQGTRIRLRDYCRPDVFLGDPTETVAQRKLSTLDLHVRDGVRFLS
jgi:hypothetical protein